jgi:hypothetical protein
MSITSSRTSVRARIATLVAVGAVAGSFLAAGPAHAEPKGGSGGSKGCPVENANGSTTTVPVGTQVGLFHCGDDGEWHFGWATTNIVVKPPVKAGGITSTAPVAVAVRAAQ